MNYRFLLILTVCSALYGCGLKGPLYIEHTEDNTEQAEDKAQAQEPTAQPENSDNALNAEQQ